MKKLALLSLSAVFLSGCVIGGISPEVAKKTSVDFIKVLAPGAEVNVKSVQKSAGGDYQITVEANGQEVISYLSPDGTIFYPQGLNIAELTKQAAEFKKQQTQAPVVDENAEKPAEGEAVIPVEGENGIGDGAEALITPPVDNEEAAE